MRKILFFLSLSVSGCLSPNNAPISKLYVIDTDHRICSERFINDKRTLSSRWVADHPIEFCDGVVGLSAKEFMDLRTYMKGN